MITKNSTLREVYANPVGKDCVDRVLRHIGRSPRLIENPITAGMKLSALEKLLEKRAPGVVDSLIRIMNYHPHAAPRVGGPVRPAWWKEATVYQIYPRSFQDSNGDGIGDLEGIRQRVPYLKELGVDVVWLCPIYDSPCDDNGYDIRNYRKIHKDFGNMKDFSALLKELHQNGIKLMMDLVLNHTSDEHAWFKKALEDPTAPERDYYIWSKGREGKAPNNWTSFFSGSAWKRFPENKTEEHWALHLFSQKQMDLNWDNPDLRAEIYDTVNYWVNKGVDGFRLDVINLISKDSLADGNPTIGKAFGLTGIEHWFYGPRLHEFLRELRQETCEGKDIFTVGEVVGCGLEMSRLLASEQRGELDLVFNFDHLDNPGESRQNPYEFDTRYLKGHFTEWQTAYGNDCWPTLLFENHDNPRMISKIKSDPAWRPVLAKMLAVLQFTMRGTPFLYQGQELGMTNCRFEGIEELDDVESVNRYFELLENGTPPADAFALVTWGTRDHSRTPMQWCADESNAGFTEGEPWLKVNPNFPAINAKNEMMGEGTVFHFYKRLIALRRQHSSLVYGDFRPVFGRNRDVLCYFRLGEGEKFYVEVNLTGGDIKRPGPLTASHNLLVSNYRQTSAHLRPYEANLYII